jgi:cyclopropane-fatty-acyl-phospholipid synthase
MSKMLNLPRFPITERYESCDKDFVEGRDSVDQGFMFCQRCIHGSLETIIPASELYGNGYRTKTGNSFGATQAVQNFSCFVKLHCDLSKIDTVIDIGANDDTLLGMFQGKLTVGVDPHAIRAGSIPQFIEKADLSQFKSHRKLIVSSHTIEHLEDPEVMIRKVAGILNPGDVLALQFPSLELLVKDARIDQIHHQHVNYFSERSISALLARYGIGVTHRKFDESHWGALMLIAKSGIGMVKGSVLSKEGVANAIAAFDEEMMGVRIPEGAVALGASLMLPVLSYWAPELGNIEFIADDDATKNDLRYVNFNKRISNDYELRGRDVVITAVGSKSAYRGLALKALADGAARVILPLRTL